MTNNIDKNTGINEFNIASSNIYERVGGDNFFYTLVDKFYEFIETDKILRPMYPDDLAPGKSHLAKFLIQFWGGPKQYSKERGHPRLRKRHIDFTIGEKERDVWVGHMFSALHEMEISSSDLKTMENYFKKTATMMINS